MLADFTNLTTESPPITVDGPRPRPGHRPVREPGLRFELLGPLRMTRSGEPVDLGRAQQRVVLALLLLHGQRPYPRDELTTAIWGDSTPNFAVNLLQKHMSLLRQILEPDRESKDRVLLRWTDAGYVLDIAPTAVDIWEYERKIREARAARIDGDLTRAARTLDEALKAWRGPFCEGLPSPALELERERLEEQRIDAIESQIELHLLLGHDSDQIFKLRRLVAEHPLRERLRASLMLALYRVGHVSDALSVYRATRQYLRRELGVEPSLDIQRLHDRMLAADPALLSIHVENASKTTTPRTLAQPSPTSSLSAEANPASVVPGQLPHAIRNFAGRAAYIERLDAELSRREASGMAGPLIVTVAGSAGVGKTSLAIEWAHRVRDRFPDGQLYVNLRGFDPDGTPVEAGDALRGFLEAFGVGKHRMPATFESQTALYRSLVAESRVLVVLDNAKGVEQVRPLLPGSVNSAVIVTSRDDLVGLVVADGALPIPLGLLSPADAHDMLGKRLGQVRVDREPEAAGRIASACAQLPLALAIVAARAATRPNLPLEDLATELQEFAGGLDGFDGEDASSDIRRVFSWSYSSLPPAEARLFRHLGLHPGPHISRQSASALIGTPPTAATRKLLRSLAKAHLVEEEKSGHFVMHDLLRAYAGELAAGEESPEARAQARSTLLELLASMAHNADRLLSPTRFPELWMPTRMHTGVDQIANATDALAWFTVEHPVLLSALRQARDVGVDPLTYELAWGLTTFLDRAGHWHDLEVAQQIALEAAQASQDTRGEAYALYGLGRAYTWQFQFAAASDLYMAALRLFEALDDHGGQAQCHRSMAWALERQGCFVPALAESEAALALFRLAGPRAGLAEALNAVGWFRAQLGDPRSALPLCEEALALHMEVGHREGEAHTLDSLGFVHHNLGEIEDSVTCYRKSIAVWRDISDRYYEAATLVRLGHAYEAGGQLAKAWTTWSLAASTLRELGHPDAAQVELELARTAGQADPHSGSPPVDHHSVQPRMSLDDDVQSGHP